LKDHNDATARILIRLLNHINCSLVSNSD